MPNSLMISVENPEEILNAGLYGAGAVVRVQSSLTATGVYADVAGTGSTPAVAVVTGVRAYVGYDPLGIVSSWYRTRYENAAATRVSDWTTPFQVGDETAGLLCSIEDVKQRMFGTSSTVTNDDELLLDIIREVSDDIEDYVGQWLAPRPTNPASTMQLLFDVPYGTWFARRSLLLDRGHRITGIRSFTEVGIATTDQPDAAGIYVTANLADVLMRPWPTDDGPAYRILFSQYPTGSMNLFYPGRNTVSVTGSFGPARVPSRIQGIAIAAVTRRYLGKESAQPVVAIGPDGGVRLLADISPAMRATLDRMRISLVA